MQDPIRIRLIEKIKKLSIFPGMCPPDKREEFFSFCENLPIRILAEVAVMLRRRKGRLEKMSKNKKSLEEMKNSLIRFSQLSKKNGI